MPFAPTFATCVGSHVSIWCPPSTVVPALVSRGSPMAIFDHAWIWTRPGVVWATMGLFLLLFRTMLWLRYRPAAPATFADAPPLTVIIPAYNEGPMVARSIESVAAADYPRSRLQIVVVDDGSTDDTWEYVSRAASRDPGLITTIRFAGNRGKRAALQAGFLHARGEIVVTIDSDSVIDRAALLAMGGPFRDPRVGAVAGRVAVYNAGAANTLPAADASFSSLPIPPMCMNITF